MEVVTFGLDPVQGQEPARPYKERRLSCLIQPDEKIWCVSATRRDTGPFLADILEWAHDQQDAEQLAGEMRRDPRYSRVRAYPYLSLTLTGRDAGRVAL